MRPGPLRAVLCVLLLLAACSLTVGGTLSVAYVSLVTTASNAFTAADATAASATTTAIGRSTAYDTGFIAQGSIYYVYANVSDTGNPASGIASVAANVSSITSGSTAVALTAGSYSGGGTAYGYRSAALTAPAVLTAGTHSYTITSTDMAANVGTQSFNTVVDNTAPTAVDVQSTNVSGGTVGKLDKGDTLTLTTDAPIDPYSILPGWTGATTNVQVALVDGGGTSSDYVVVYNTAASATQIPLGQVNLNATGYLTGGTGTFVTYGANGSPVPSTITRSGSTITVSLGTASASVSTSSTAARMTWAPSTSATDIAGNANTTAIATQSGTVHINF
jgi:hypothetical protein